MTHVRRTLLGAGIGALLAMVFVPCIHQGYEPVFNAAEYRINVAQLVLNISFAALVGALAFNLSRRALCWSAASAILIVTALFGLPAYHEQMRSGAVTEEGLAYAAAAIPDLGLAKEHMLRAANYWWWKGWWEQSRKDKELAATGGINLSRLPDQPGPPWERYRKQGFVPPPVNSLDQPAPDDQHTSPAHRGLFDDLIPSPTPK